MFASLHTGIDEEEAQRQNDSKVEEAPDVAKEIVEEDVEYHWNREYHHPQAAPEEEFTAHVTLVGLQV